MAVPFRRTSKTRKRMRRAHQSLKVTGLVKCSNCGALIRSHHVCPKCGYYGGKAVLAIKGKEKESRETKKAARKTKKQASVKKAEKETKDGQETKDE